jgi:UDP-N-acetylmuramoyl-L-alanyl-D-glutamate--2,6-diaminopimelate ligase
LKFKALMDNWIAEFPHAHPPKGPSSIFHKAEEIEVSSITDDSRKIQPGTIFVAVKGAAHDGHLFIKEAGQAGAVLVIGEEPLSKQDLVIPYIEVANSRLALAELASCFYGHPARAMKVVGVTGTSGKTTSTFLVESILKAAGNKVGVIGTVSFRYGSKVLDASHTTPGPVDLQKLLAAMRAEGCTAVVMEVSSHALKQKRVTGIAFDSMIFTNLSPEHLDFHPDMEDYFQSKALLFTDLARDSERFGKKPVAAINGEDEYGKRLIAELKNKGFPKTIRSFGLGAENDYNGTGLQIELEGISGEIQLHPTTIPVKCRLTGSFNALNILGAVAATEGWAADAFSIEVGITDLEPVPGRLEKVEHPTAGVHVWVDYAHKSDALQKVLTTLRQVAAGRKIFTVFGCGGDRDRKKRPVMGKIAVETSDYVFITSDNPRTEDPKAIINEILAGTAGSTNFKVIPDRKTAIVDAINMAAKGDLVLIAGKGHENYQIIGDPRSPEKTLKIHFDDREVARDALENKAVPT